MCNTLSAFSLSPNFGKKSFLTPNGHRIPRCTGTAVWLQSYDRVLFLESAPHYMTEHDVSADNPRMSAPSSNSRNLRLSGEPGTVKSPPISILLPSHLNTDALGCRGIGRSRGPLSAGWSPLMSPTSESKHRASGDNVGWTRWTMIHH